jgi:hypothetical protein
MLMQSMQTSLLEEMEKTKVFEANEHHKCWFDVVQNLL